MNLTLLGISIYIGLQFLIGVVVSRRIRTEADYLVAGRQLGLVLATFSIFATWFGAETIVGAAGAIYHDGLSGASADPFGYVLCILLLGAFFAAPLWRRGYMTFGDLFRDRFSPGVERLFVLLTVPTSVIWAAAQVRAFGQVLSSITEWHVDATIAIATGLVIGYTAFGGLLADAWTDLVQGISLVIGLLLIGVSLWWHTPVDVIQSAMHSDRLKLLSGAETPWHETAESWAIPVLGSLFAVELVSRVLACNSPETAKRACWFGGMLYLVVGLIPVSVGLLGPHLHPELEDPEQLMPLVAVNQLGSMFLVIFSGTLISAILSTVDSSLLAASALISHNLIGNSIRDLSDQARVRFARCGVVGLGILAYLIARRGESVHDLVELASAFSSSGVFVIVCFGMRTKVGGALSAYGALVTGAAVWSLGEFYFGWSAPYLISIVTAIAVYLLLAFKK